MARHVPMDDLADAIQSGRPVDWVAAEAGTVDEDERRMVRHLKAIARIADVHTRAALSATETSAADTHEADDPSPPSWGPFRLLERVGSGAHGEVYRAWDPHLGREVALKLLHRRNAAANPASSTVLQEGRLLAQVRHPNVVTVYGADSHDGRIGLWMEFIHGGTLEQRLRERGPFAVAEVVSIGLELCGAVSAVHAAGLLHRDIKAHNVTRDDTGRIVLMDFGTGRELDDTSSSDLAGTPLYLAPEVLAGRPATVRSDIYSLGVLLYHLATNSYPVTGRTIRDVRRAHERSDRVALRRSRPRVRPALAQLIERAIDPDPSRRHATARALAHDLARLPRRPAIRRLANAALVLAALALLAFAASQVHARMIGDRRGVATRMASLIGLRPAYLDGPVIVVLPFTMAGGRSDSRFLVDHVTAGLIRQLASIDGLEVRSETSSFMLRDTKLARADIGRQLDVNLLVEGGARWSDQALVIDAALVSIHDARRIWSGTVHRQLSAEADVAAVIDELTRTIVNEFRLKLGPTRRQYRTTDIATFELYLRARALRDARLLDAPKAIPMFEEVLRRDRSYAPALAALAISHLSRAATYPNAVGSAIPPELARLEAEPLARRALEIDPMLGEAHAAFAEIYASTGQWERSEASFRRAIELEPQLTALYGDFVLSTLLPLGRVEEALRTMEQALRADPLSLDARRVLARSQVAAGLFDDALDNCRQVLAQAPAYQFAEEICGLALMFQGRTDEALALFQKRATLNEHWIGYIYASTGRRTEAEAMAERNAHLPHRQAMIYAALGDKDRAFAALTRLAQLNPPRAATYLSLRELASLHDDPRAVLLRQQLGLPR